MDELRDFIEEVELPNWYVNFDKPLTLGDYYKRVLPILQKLGCKKDHLFSGMILLPLRDDYKPWSSSLSKTDKNYIRGGISSITRLKYKNIAKLSRKKVRIISSGLYEIFDFTVLTEEEFFNLKK
jgi:hypothetical protein